MYYFPFYVWLYRHIFDFYFYAHRYTHPIFMFYRIQIFIQPNTLHWMERNVEMFWKKIWQPNLHWWGISTSNEMKDETKQTKIQEYTLKNLPVIIELFPESYCTSSHMCKTRWSRSCSNSKDFRKQSVFFF